MLFRYFMHMGFVACSFFSLFYACDEQSFLDAYKRGDKHQASTIFQGLEKSVQNALFVTGINEDNEDNALCHFLLDNKIDLSADSAGLVIHWKKLSVYKKMVQKGYFYNNDTTRDLCIKVIMQFRYHEFLRCLIDCDSELPSTMLIPADLPPVRKEEFTTACLTYGLKYRLSSPRQALETQLQDICKNSASFDSYAKKLRVDAITMLKIVLAQCNNSEVFYKIFESKSFNDQNKCQILEHLLLLDKRDLIESYIQKNWNDFSFDTLYAIAKKQDVFRKQYYIADKAFLMFKLPVALRNSRYPKNVTISFASNAA